MNPFMSDIFLPYFKQSSVSLIDIGASGGIKDNWKKYQEYLYVIGFEPDEKAYVDLIKNKKSNEVFIKIALNKKKDVLNFYITRKQEVSSTLLPDEDILKDFPDKKRFDVLKKVSVKADSLDNVLKANKIFDIDSIKIDTQGSGLDILEGSTETLKDVFCVEIEAEFLPIYKNQQLFADIDIFLRNNGFYLFDLRPWYWKREKGKNFGNPRGQIIFSDCIYLKNPASVLEILNNRENAMEKKRKLLKMIFISNLFGYIDYSFEIFDSNKELFSSEEQEAFITFANNQVMWRTGSSFIGNLEYIKET